MKDIYLFAIVGVLVLIDIVILIPPTAVSSAILRREQEEVEGEDVSALVVMFIKLTVLFCRLVICLK